MTAASIWFEILGFVDTGKKKFDFFQAISHKNLDFQAKLTIYSCFWANHFISLQKSQLLNILLVHDKI